MPGDDTATWTEAELDGLAAEFRGIFGGRTVVVTGADGFMGSHLTEALVHLGENVTAFVRATSSGALNNNAHFFRIVNFVFAYLSDRTSVYYRVLYLAAAPDRPYICHRCAQ